MSIFVPHSVNFHVDSASAILIGGITSENAGIATEINSEEVAGSPYALNSTVKSQKPTIGFSTRDLKKAIDICGLIGASIKGATNPGLELWLAQIADGVVMSGTNHKKLQMRNGRLVIRRLSASHQDDAQVDLEAMSIFDGTNAPLIPSTASLALPGVPADPARHTLKDVTFGGVSITGIQSVDIDFGLTIDMLSYASEVYDMALLLSKIQPSITIRTLHPNQFLPTGAVPLAGLAGTHANTTIRLRKRATGATPFVADATAEHIVITTAGLLTCETPFQSSAFKRGEITYKITTRFDGTNVPLIFNTASALA